MNQEKDNFLKSLMNIGKKIAELSKDKKVASAIKQRANY